MSVLAIFLGSCLEGTVKDSFLIIGRDLVLARFRIQFILSKSLTN